MLPSENLITSSEYEKAKRQNGNAAFVNLQIQLRCYVYRILLRRLMPTLRFVLVVAASRVITVYKNYVRYPPGVFFVLNSLIRFIYNVSLTQYV